MLSPFQGLVFCYSFTQGFALCYLLMPFHGKSRTSRILSFNELSILENQQEKFYGKK
jgi:hypothetical protein